jgi:hypothetical protein
LILSFSTFLGCRVICIYKDQWNNYIFNSKILVRPFFFWSPLPHIRHHIFNLIIS